MAASSTAVDVQVALQRAKRRMFDLQLQLLHKETSSENPEETSPSTWTPSKELRDSLVDMYRANPRVNEELRHRLPSPGRPPNSPHRSGSEPSSWPQAPHHLQDPPTSNPPTPLSYRRSASPLSPPCHRRAVSPLSPLSLRRSASPLSPVSHHRSASPLSPLSPLSRRRSASQLSVRPPAAVGPMEVDPLPSRGASPLAERSDDVPDGSGRSRGPGTPPLSRQDGGSGPVEAAGRAAALDQNKNLSLLLKELDALRDVNTKLNQQLSHQQEALQRREVEEQLKEELEEARAWERPTAMLEEVLAAQKDRDQALMSRLLLANEDRDEALLRIRRLQQAAESETTSLGDSDLEVDELLQRVCDADSVQEVEQFGAVLVQHLRLARQRRSDITAQEMKAVMEERDGSVSKCQRLEHDLVQEREQRVNKEELLSLQRERDSAVDDRCRLEAELQALQANESSQGLLPHPSLAADGDAAGGHQQAPPLLLQLQQLSKEKQRMAAELQRCQEAEREAIERVRRLERLVEVLRKKVGTGSLRAVI